MPAEEKKKGEMVEGFRILDILGHGAASIIYLVHDPKSKQVWALKHVAKEGPKDQRFLDQAESEYTVSSRLNHAAIRKVERIIRKKEGLLGGTAELYLVMELVDGTSSQDNPPKTFEDAAWVFEQTAKGLAYMHEHGYVHADMKPNNIIVDDKTNVKIIDLGQSCKIGTVKERIQGTPEYIAPEQVHRRPITPKTDVYNLGAAMYWIMTRQYVPSALGGEDSLVKSIEDSRIPKATPVQEINPRVPEMMAELIGQCIQIDTECRPGMEQVADRLNLIRGKLHAEALVRKSGVRTDHNGARGPGDSKGAAGDTNIMGSSGAPTGAGARGGGKGGRKRGADEPPIDPGPGLTDE